MNEELTLNEYQRRAMTTCMDSCDNFSYMMLNLVGEVGEFASKIAKHIRKEKAEIVFGNSPDSARSWAGLLKKSPVRILTSSPTARLAE